MIQRGHLIAAGAVLLGSMIWMIQEWRHGARMAEVLAEHAQERAQHARAALDAVQAARAEEQRRAAAMEDARNEARKQLAAADAAATAARAAERRLRQRIDALVANAARRDPGLAAGGPAAGPAIDMLAHMLGRAVDAAGQLAEHADRSRIAGLTCERAYDRVRGDGLR